MELTKSTARLAAASAATAGLVLVAAACGSNTGADTAVSMGGLAQSRTDITTSAARAASSGTVRKAGTSESAGTTETKGTNATTGTAATTATGPALRCRTTSLKARIGQQDAGAGQRYAALVLTNGSSKTCWVYGFVGLIMIDGHGDALRTRTRRESVQPSRVTLRPGASAHARLHWTVVPSGSETRCPAAARLMIIPPDEVAHLEIPFTATVCGDGRLDVTPMAAGARL